MSSPTINQTLYTVIAEGNRGAFDKYQPSNYENITDIEVLREIIATQHSFFKKIEKEQEEAEARCWKFFEKCNNSWKEKMEEWEKKEDWMKKEVKRLLNDNFELYLALHPDSSST